MEIYVVNLGKTEQTSKLNTNLPKINVNIALVYDEKDNCHRNRGIIPSRDSEIRGVIVRIAKANTILKHPVNKLFTVENTYHDTNQSYIRQGNESLGKKQP